MSFFSVLKCAMCFRWSCPKRYQIGNRTYYSHLGFVRTECPKKTPQKTMLTMDERREQIKKKTLEHQKIKEQQQKLADTKKVVLVDDNLQFAKVVSEFIKETNKTECMVFTNPEVLLNHLESNHADVLLTDYQMPVMNGCELAKVVLEKYPDIRVIIMSGYDSGYIEQACKKYDIYGRVEFVCKSYIDTISTLI